MYICMYMYMRQKAALVNRIHRHTSKNIENQENKRERTKEQQQKTASQ